MGKVHKLKDKYESCILLNYTFANDNTVSFQILKDLPESIQTENVINEFDLAKSWCNYAKQALGDDEFSESSLTCWHGHYEQFGRVMLELMRMSRDKESHKENEKLYELIPDLTDFEYIAEPLCSEDRLFYRIWFNLIMHPHFNHSRLLGMERWSYAFWDYYIQLAVIRINRELRESN